MKTQQTNPHASRPFETTMPFLALFCCLPLTAMPTQAQQQVQPQKDALASAVASLTQEDAKISAAKLQWKAVRTVAPNPNADVEKAVESVKAQLRQRGKSEVEIEGYAAATRVSVGQSARGFTQSSSYVFTRVGPKVRADVVQSAPISQGQSPNLQRASFIDYYDGRNLVTLESMGTTSPWNGDLTRPKGVTLPHGAPDPVDLYFLSAGSIAPFFDSAQTTVKRADNQQIILEKQVQKQYPALLRLTFSLLHKRAVSFEEVNLLDGQSLVRYRAEDFRSYEAISFPQKVVVERGGTTTLYTLQNALFNQAVDPTDLLLPARATLDDYRFQEAVRYVLKDGQIPTDATVQEKLGQVKAKEAAFRKEQEVSSPSWTSLPGLGLLCIAGGLIIWPRKNRERSQKD